MLFLLQITNGQAFLVPGSKQAYGPQQAQSQTRAAGKDREMSLRPRHKQPSFYEGIRGGLCTSGREMEKNDWKGRILNTCEKIAFNIKL